VSLVLGRSPPLPRSSRPTAITQTAAATTSPISSASEGDDGSGGQGARGVMAGVGCTAAHSLEAGGRAGELNRGAGRAVGAQKKNARRKRSLGGTLGLEETPTPGYLAGRNNAPAASPADATRTPRSSVQSKLTRCGGPRSSRAPSLCRSTRPEQRGATPKSKPQWRHIPQCCSGGHVPSRSGGGSRGQRRKFAARLSIEKLPVCRETESTLVPDHNGITGANGERLWVIPEGPIWY
jgi:hypothetical protein